MCNIGLASGVVAVVGLVARGVLIRVTASSSVMASHAADGGAGGTRDKLIMVLVLVARVPLAAEAAAAEEGDEQATSTGTGHEKVEAWGVARARALPERGPTGAANGGVAGQKCPNARNREVQTHCEADDCQQQEENSEAPCQLAAASATATVHLDFLSAESER